MAQSRTLLSIKNSVVALGFYLVNLMLQFYSRQVFFVELGTEVLGLNTTATSLLQFLNLAELGVGSAIGVTLYKPLLEKNYTAINEIVSLQGWLYKRIAYFIIIGSAVLMWIGERITEKGVGNGISIVLLINIISRVPDDLVTLYTQFMSGKKLAKAGLAGIIILAILLVVIVFVIILQDGERRIAVQYSKKVQGRKTYGGQSSHIPLKVNTAGVIPVIFSSSLMQTPIVIAQFLGKGNGTGIGSKILAGLNSNNWCDPENPIYSIGLVVYILLTIFFAYFYTSITFNPMEIANNMKKSGGFIPGIRPGKPTVDYLTKILNYIIFIGACGLIIVQVIPYFFNGVFGANVSFGGTSLIIIVGVVLETIKKIESQMLVRNYTGFLNNKGSNMKNSYLGY